MTTADIYGNSQEAFRAAAGSAPVPLMVFTLLLWGGSRLRLAIGAGHSNNNHNFGWIGLIGLIGLAGLSRRDRGDRTTTSGNSGNMNPTWR